MRLRLAFGVAMAMSAAAWAAPPATRPGPANPTLERFNSAITLYVSFDQRPLQADLAAGDPRPRDPKLKVELKPGLFGQAMLNTDLSFTAAGNLNLSKTGAVALWIAPWNWEPRGPDEPYLFPLRINDRGRTLMIGRMGRMQKPRRGDMVYAYAQAGKEHLSVRQGGSLDWKPGQWHLLVMNWRPQSLEFSLDGRPPARGDDPWFAQADGKPGQIFIGDKGKMRYLLDELMVLDRPLSVEEIQWIYRQGRSASATPP